MGEKRGNTLEKGNKVLKGLLKWFGLMERTMDKRLAKRGSFGISDGKKREGEN